MLEFPFFVKFYTMIIKCFKDPSFIIFRSYYPVNIAFVLFFFSDHYILSFYSFAQMQASDVL